MKKTRKIISCISALCMVFSTSAINVSAENIIGDIPAAEIIDDNGVLKYNTEKCGDNISWSFDDETGTLTLSGTGSTFDYHINETHIQKPWSEYKDSITNVVIEEGITNIGTNLFCKYGSIKSVTLPESLESIDKCAFLNCSIENLTLPSNLKRIGDGAFALNSMKELIIPEGVTDIGYGTFGKCYELVSAVIPSTLENSSSLFYECTSLTNVTISDGMEVLGDSMFNKCTALTDITIPDSVKKIDISIFEHCDSLKNVRLSENLETIGYTAFLYCKSLENISIPDSVSYIGLAAFNGTPLLDNQETPVKYVDKWIVCYKCYNPDTLSTVESIELKDDTVGIADSALSDLENLKSIVVPESVKFINENAFLGCSSLSSITIENPDCVISDWIAGVVNKIVWCDNNTKISIIECLDIEKDIYKAIDLNTDEDILLRKTPFGYRAVETGDATTDGNIDVRDVAALKKDIVKLETLPDYVFTADINSDGAVDVKDLGLLNKYIIKVIDKF